MSTSIVSNMIAEFKFSKNERHYPSYGVWDGSYSVDLELRYETHVRKASFVHDTIWSSTSMAVRIPMEKTKYGWLVDEKSIYLGTRWSSGERVDLLKHIKSLIHDISTEERMIWREINTYNRSSFCQDIKWGPPILLQHASTEWVHHGHGRSSTGDLVKIPMEWYDVDTLLWNSSEYEYLAREYYMNRLSVWATW